MALLNELFARQGSTVHVIINRHFYFSDGDFEPNRSESDDEETIAKEEQECALDESEQQEELTELERESTMPLDELLNSLPKEILEKPASLEPTNQERGSEDGVSVKVSVDNKLRQLQ